MKIQSYKELRVWQQAVDLADIIFEQTEPFPKREQYGLASHMRKTATSIASNIAEGSGRAGTKELIHFLHVARGSLLELETQYLIACRRNFITNEKSKIQANELMTSISKMLIRLIQSLQNSKANEATKELLSTNH